MQKDSLGRLSAQSALYYLLQLLLALLAPIVSFTAEEAWQELRKIDPMFDLPESVLNVRWSQLSELFEVCLLPGDPTEEEWQLLLRCREAVNVALEEVRSRGKIGSSLEAKVTLLADGELQKLLTTWGGDLRWLFIVSQLELAADKTEALVGATTAQLTASVDCKILVTPIHEAKCERCWHRLPEVGQDHQHPTLCKRCINNIWGNGEQRRLG